MYKIIQRLLQDIKNYYIGVLIFILYSIVVRHIFHAFCPQLIIAGIPCAGCGMTRAIYYILTGHFQRGMDLNPAAPLWIIWFMLGAIERYVIGRNRKWILYLLVCVCVVTLLISIVSSPDILQKKFIVQILHILSQFIAIYMGYMIKYIYNFLCLTEEMYFL